MYFMETYKEKNKVCRLVSKTLVSCTLEDKCYFEMANLSSGDIVFKSPKTRNQKVRSLKEFAADYYCG